MALDDSVTLTLAGSGIAHDLLRWLAMREGIAAGPVFRLVIVPIDGKESELAAYTIQAGESKRFRIEARDEFGNVATLAGEPAWSVTDEAVLAVEPEAGGLTATVRSLGPAGTAQVRAEADAEQDEEVRLVVGIRDIQVDASEATVIELVPIEEEAPA